MSLKNILGSWASVLFEEPNEVHLERAQTCNACPRKEKGLIKKLLPTFETESIEGYKCGECGCPLIAKIRNVEDQERCKKWER